MRIILNNVDIPVSAIDFMNSKPICDKSGKLLYTKVEIRATIKLPEDEADEPLVTT